MTKIHKLTEKNQKKYYYSIGPYEKPVLTVDSGDTLIIDTVDTFNNKIKDEKTKAQDVTNIPYLNPQNGPIFVRGAEKGDVLEIYIKEISPRGPQPRGTTCLINKLGALTGTYYTVSLDDSIPELTKKTIVTKDYIQWDENIKLPYKPFIGTISTSPELDSINSLTPGQHGGNMDLQYTAPGAKVYLPVKVEGAYLFLGDCHANQGDGEICGNAIEISSCTTIIVNLKKNWNIKWPRIENDEYIISVGSARPLEDAVRIAYGDLIDWMAADYDFDKLDAYMLLSQVGKLKLGNVVDPNYTVGAKIHKKYLKKN